MFCFRLTTSARSDLAGLRSDIDKWLGGYEDATALANDALNGIQVNACLFVVLDSQPLATQGSSLLSQERNLKHPAGGPEASRESAAARRKLATLGMSLDKLADILESAECTSV